MNYSKPQRRGWQQRLVKKVVARAAIFFETGAEWARSAGVCQATVSRWRRGQVKEIRLSTLVKLCGPIGFEVVIHHPEEAAAKRGRRAA